MWVGSVGIPSTDIQTHHNTSLSPPTDIHTNKKEIVVRSCVKCTYVYVRQEGIYTPLYVYIHPYTSLYVQVIHVYTYGHITVQESISCSSGVLKIIVCNKI